MNEFRLFVASIAGLVATIVALPLVILLLPLIFVLLATRLASRWIEPSYLSWQEVIQFDPHFGWKNRENISGFHLADDAVYRTTTDSDGWRGTASIDGSQVLVFGDSYAFGHASSDQYFFADLNPNLRVKAIGANGYNMVQEYLWIRELASRLRGKLVVWFIYLGNDLADNVEASMEGYRIPFVRELREANGWEIVTSHLRTSPWPSGARSWLSTFSERRAKMFVPGPSSDRMFSACEYLIANGADVVQQAGGMLAVVSLPFKDMLTRKGEQVIKSCLCDASRFDVNYPDSQLAEICAKLALPFVAGRGRLGLEHYRVVETHWNVKGSQRVANLVDDLYRRFEADVAEVLSQKKRAFAPPHAGLAKTWP
jgi:hypothetical protein